MHLITTQRGVSLVEVMVAITVLGFGLLGLAGTHLGTPSRELVEMDGMWLTRRGKAANVL